MQNTKNKTLILTFSGIAVFVIGAVMGSFLVLRSHTGEGKEFYIKKDSNQIASSKMSLLAEINKERGSYYEPLESGYTEALVQAMIDESIRKDISINELNDEEFYDKAAGYVIAQGIDIFPQIADADIQISSDPRPSEYIVAATEHFKVLRKTFGSLTNASPNSFEDSKIFSEYFDVLNEMSASTEEFSHLLVPQDEEIISFHKDVLSFSVALQHVIEFGILRVEEDPILSAVVMRQLRPIYDKAKEIDGRYINLYELHAE